ncbi:MAG: dihydrofolate reductase family protein [Bacteroidetes bacterium]|nr:dihydrofolate reductase family protein [Bacteroidota bacterium]
MAKLIVFNLITLDGFFEGLNSDISWHNVDEEFNEFAIENLNSIGGLVFGRVTYQLMASYWQTKQGVEDDPVVAAKMNSLPKYVFSKTLDKAEWNNSKLIKENIEDEILKLKRRTDKDLDIFGSGKLISSLIETELIDEYRIMVNPIILGKGNPLFTNINEKLNLELINTRLFKNGNVLLCYKPAAGK